MDLEKVQTIVNRPTLRNVFEVRRFHGLASFYRKFISSSNQICTPIIETIKEINQPFKWKETTYRNFKLLKKKITENPMLALPSFDKNF